jgi:hypothetical protein
MALEENIVMNPRLFIIIFSPTDASRRKVDSNEKCWKENMQWMIQDSFVTT